MVSSTPSCGNVLFVRKTQGTKIQSESAEFEFVLPDSVSSGHDDQQRDTNGSAHEPDGRWQRCTDRLRLCGGQHH